MKKIYTLENCIHNIGEIPLCQCGCGNKVNINPKYYYKYKIKGYPKFINYHQLKGKIPWNKDILTSKETRLKQSESAKKRFLTNIHPMKGKHHTKESKLKNFESHKGKPAWNKGLKGICKSNSGTFKKGQIPWNFGLTKNTDERVKINAENNSKPHIGKINDGCGNNFGTGDYYLIPNQGSVFMRSFWELKYAEYLDDNKINYLYEPYSFKMNINGKETTY